MPPLSRRRAADALTIALAGVLLSAVLLESIRTSAAKLALFGAAAIAVEALRRAHDELLPDDLEGERFALTSPIHLAAIFVAGPWVAAAVAAWSVVCVGPFKGETPLPLLRRGAAIGASAIAGGLAFQLAGGAVGHMRLPDDLLPVAVAGIVYVTARTLLEGLATSRTTLPDLVTSSSEIGLGLVLAFAALQELWLAVALVPLLLLVERLYGRVVALRREVATALETFANIVDERDPSTRGHSVRVAGYVRDLARALGLHQDEVSRLWWAGRLHDLGKVAVDSVVLGKPGKLTLTEWSAVWRAPRLSARLLQRFRFAARQAQAVEYHRERYDGSGYYGAQRDDIPLAAHFLIVADSFDAMTTDRPFRRRRLTHEEALGELERSSGTQFHPSIAKAFAAVRRGRDPADVLSAEELAAIRDASGHAKLDRSRPSNLSQRPELLALCGVTAALAGLGIHLGELTAAGTAVALAGSAMWLTRRRRVAHLTTALNQALPADGDRLHVFDRVVAALDPVWKIDYAALVDWDEDGAGGTIARERGDGPPEPVLLSWLLREAESGREVGIDDGGELGAGGVSVALPLRRENSELVGFVVLCGKEHPPRHVEPAVTACLDRFALAVSVRSGSSQLDRSRASRPLHAGQGQARSLEA
jgi:HD-GYP domain-containing protein (c-di-GMP phosphodiesterase class II)